MVNYEELTDKELLGILINEKKGENVSENIFQEFITLPEILLNSAEEELIKIKGIGYKRILQIKACYELAKRLQQKESREKKIIKSSRDVSDLLMFEMRYLKRELFKIILLDTKNTVICIETISIGSLNASIVHPREVFNLPLRRSANAVIFVHNHPSGCTEPSVEDIATTNRLLEAGNILGIKVLDHIIIGDGNFLSFKEHELI